MSRSGVLTRLEPIFSRIDGQIRDQLSSDVPFVSRVCQYILLAGGKRLRPSLFILAAHICDYPGDQEYRYSAAFEYVHAATLLHDDVVDQSDTRRGQKAAHLVYGNQGVILVGDYLMAKALAIAAETGRMVFIEVMADTMAHMAEGEVLQLLHAHDPRITEAEYEEVILRKTGVLIQSASHLGAVLAEAPETYTEALKHYGRHLGLAFQIIDDTLDFTTTQAEFGKPVGHDLDEGKITLPVIRALAQAEGTDKDELTALVSRERRSPQEFNRVKTLIDKYQGIEQSLQRAAAEIELAKNALSSLPERPEKADLSDLADYIVTRRK
ncbi:MAG: polyprenyl synthetase family protein [Thermodesulfobacteriota bacterium]